MNITLPWLVAALLFVVPTQSSPPRDPDLDTLADWLVGEYTTAEQAESDRRVNAAYQHDHVVLRIVRITVSGLAVPAGAHVFYLEQAMKGAEATPYRQRVLSLYRTSHGLLTIRTYRISTAGDVAGARLDLARLNGLRADRLTPESGCDVTWARVDRALYLGAGGGDRSCRTSSRGATHVTTQGGVTADTLVSLDQGYDDSGSQRWGPPQGVVGYTFRKRR